MLRVYPGRIATPRISDFFEKKGGATSWSSNKTGGRRGDDHLCPRSATDGRGHRHQHAPDGEMVPGMKNGVLAKTLNLRDRYVPSAYESDISLVG